MKRIISIASFFVFCLSALANSGTAPVEGTLASGSQPQVSVDSKGILRVIFGKGDHIYYTESSDKGASFSAVVLVGTVPGMHLGMSRGPQLASSKFYSIVTAMDKSGNIHWFRLRHLACNWENMGLINEPIGSAPEGLMNVAADDNDHFYAVWLDIRSGKQNQIAFSDLAPKEKRWSKNKLIYLSSDGHVCECCQPHIAVSGNNVAVMFRNWLSGSRDLYLIRSGNGGLSFSAAEKLGTNTWKLNGCPMDGGGITIKNSFVETTWQRQGQIYYCKPGQLEMYIGKGRNSSIATTGSNAYIGYQSGDSLKMVNVRDNRTQIVGAGEFMKTAVLPNKAIFCVWEQDGKIKYKKV